MAAQGTCPVVGLNSAERIETASEALSVELAESEIEMLEELYKPLAIQAI
jgi:aryl-alcohol dehydrogenase-like predicted oxidoreductase